MRRRIQPVPTEPKEESLMSYFILGAVIMCIGIVFGHVITKASQFTKPKETK